VGAHHPSLHSSYQRLLGVTAAAVASYDNNVPPRRWASSTQRDVSANAQATRKGKAPKKKAEEARGMETDDNMARIIRHSIIPALPIPDTYTAEQKEQHAMVKAAYERGREAWLQADEQHRQRRKETQDAARTALLDLPSKIHPHLPEVRRAALTEPNTPFITKSDYSRMTDGEKKKFQRQRKLAAKDRAKYG